MAYGSMLTTMQSIIALSICVKDSTGCWELGTRQSKNDVRFWAETGTIVSRYSIMNAWRERGASNTSQLQQQREQTKSAHCLTVLVICGQWCRHRLCATAGDTRWPAVRLYHGPAENSQACWCKQSAFAGVNWMSGRRVPFSFLQPFLYRKRKRNEKADIFFGRKIKCRKIKKRAFSGTEK